MGKPLTDEVGRQIDYVRLSVNDRCDVHCRHCSPVAPEEFVDSEAWLSVEEVGRLARIFARLGVRRVRLAGADPLVRRDLPELAAGIAAVPGIDDISVSTNGTRLEGLADALARAGVTRVNVNLPTLDPGRYERLTGAKLERVLAGLKAVRAAGLGPIKINTWLRPDIRDEEIEDLIVFGIEHGYVLRLIEDLPAADSARSGARLQEIRRRLARRLALEPANPDGGGPARYVRLHGTDFLIGFIAPFSDRRDGEGNRVRVTADGDFYPSLAPVTAHPLRPLLTAGVDDTEIEGHIRRAVGRRPVWPDQHDATTVARLMTVTGG